jgi:hypothetical protein
MVGYSKRRFLIREFEKNATILQLGRGAEK